SGAHPGYLIVCALQSPRSHQMKSAATGVLLGCLLFVAGYRAAANDTVPSPEEARVAEIKRQILALNWIHGPQRVQLFGNSALDVPGGFMFLNPADTARL